MKVADIKEVLDPGCLYDSEPIAGHQVVLFQNAVGSPGKDCFRTNARFPGLFPHRFLLSRISYALFYDGRPLPISDVLYSSIFCQLRVWKRLYHEALLAAAPHPLVIFAALAGDPGRELRWRETLEEFCRPLAVPLDFQPGDHFQIIAEVREPDPSGRALLYAFLDNKVLRDIV